MAPPQQRPRNAAEQEAGAAKNQSDRDRADWVVEDADIGQRLSLLPPAAMPRRAAGGARGGAEFGTGLARVVGLDDFASFTEWLFRQRAARAKRQRLRAVHFVEMGFVDF